MAEIVFLPQAVETLKKISEGYDASVPGYRDRAMEQLIARFMVLEYSPEIGNAHPDPFLALLDYRVLIFRDYGGVYRLLGASAYVYGIYGVSGTDEEWLQE